LNNFLEKSNLDDGITWGLAIRLKKKSSRLRKPPEMKISKGKENIKEVRSMLS